jgi:hypothetical protein
MLQYIDRPAGADLEHGDLGHLVEAHSSWNIEALAQPELQGEALSDYLHDLDVARGNDCVLAYDHDADEFPARSADTMDVALSAVEEQQLAVILAMDEGAHVDMTVIAGEGARPDRSQAYAALYPGDVFVEDTTIRTWRTDQLDRRQPVNHRTPLDVDLREQLDRGSPWEAEDRDSPVWHVEAFEAAQALRVEGQALPQDLIVDTIDGVREGVAWQALMLGLGQLEQREARSAERRRRRARTPLPTNVPKGRPHEQAPTRGRGPKHRQPTGTGSAVVSAE